MTQADLAEIEDSYRDVKDRLRDLGFVLPGSLTERWTICGKAGCRCAADPPRRHGPYIEYTRKVAGKTAGRRLTAEQAEQYRTWITNRRTLDRITASMDDLSQRAAQLITNPPP